MIRIYLFDSDLNVREITVDEDNRKAALNCVAQWMINKPEVLDSINKATGIEIKKLED